MVTDSAVLVRLGSLRLDLLGAVAGNAQLSSGPREQERLLTPVRKMAQLATPLFERRMAILLLPLRIDRPMAAVAILSANLDQQLAPLRAMRVMAGGAITGHEGAMEARHGQGFADNLMAVGAKLALLLLQHSLVPALMRQMAAETVGIARWLMIDRPVSRIISMAVQA
jgi:hypothetical protein